MSLWTRATALLLAALWVASVALAHEPKPAKRMEHGANGAVPLYDDLGHLTYPISTKHELAQRYFDQGLRLTYAFNHDEARRAFREAQRLDPSCAMCYWGEAFVLGPNINAPMSETAENPAVTAMTKAQVLAQNATEQEQAWIRALATRYTDDANADRAALDQAYANAMADMVQRFPDDQEMAVFYVDAIMNLSPWDYWEADGQTPKGKIAEAIKTAEKVLAVNPHHPGAIHLYIHLTEASTTPERAEPYANRLASLMPGAGHLVHMPSHTFFRLGRYEDSAATNKAAVKVDEAYIAAAKPDNLYAYGYYPHNIHFVMVSAQMTGDGLTALDYAKRLDGKIPDTIAAQVGWLQTIKQSPYFAHAQFSAPATILALPDPGAKFPFVQAMWHYARGVAFAAQGDIEPARREAARIAEINQRSDFSFLLAWGVPAPDVLRLARHVVEGRIAQAQGQINKSIEEFRIAVQIQDSLAYTEPPYWYYPVRQSLGAALLMAGQPAAAEQVFVQSLKRVPNNGWTLYGLMKAQQAQGHTSAAQETEKRFQQAWAGKPDTLSLNRL
jgi:tetratricopeptide (TPR) repeat protein